MRCGALSPAEGNTLLGHHTFCGGCERHGLAQACNMAPVGLDVQQQHGACGTHTGLHLQPKAHQHTFTLSASFLPLGGQLQLLCPCSDSKALRPPQHTAALCGTTPSCHLLYSCAGHWIFSCSRPLTTCVLCSSGSHFCAATPSLAALRFMVYSPQRWPDHSQCTSAGSLPGARRCFSEPCTRVRLQCRTYQVW